MCGAWVGSSSVPEPALDHSPHGPAEVLAHLGGATCCVREPGDAAPAASVPGRADHGQPVDHCHCQPGKFWVLCRNPRVWRAPGLNILVFR